jgi:DNA-binding PadR family transcriptional regulator
VKKLKNLGALEQLVLMAILRVGDQAYGTRVIRELDERADRKVSPGALYATLDRLEDKGLLRSRLGDATPGRGGRRKRLLEVTEPGFAALRKDRQAWLRMAEGLGPVLEE